MQRALGGHAWSPCDDPAVGEEAGAEPGAERDADQRARGRARRPPTTRPAGTRPRRSGTTIAGSPSPSAAGELAAQVDAVERLELWRHGADAARVVERARARRRRGARSPAPRSPRAAPTIARRAARRDPPSAAAATRTGCPARRADVRCRPGRRSRACRRCRARRRRRRSRHERLDDLARPARARGGAGTRPTAAGTTIVSA